MGGGGFRGTHSGKPRKQKGKMPMNNQNQNEQFKAVVSKLKLTKDQARRLHDDIQGLYLDYKELLDHAKICLTNNERIEFDEKGTVNYCISSS